MIGLAFAMVILGAALKIMATMSWDDIARSLAVLAGSLGILAGAMNLMKKAIPGALAMMIVAPALLLLTGVLALMGGFSWEEIAKGLVTLGGALLIISGAMALMKKAIPGAAALTIVTAALAILAPVLRSFGNMSLGEIGKSLLFLAGIFVIFGIAAKVLTPVVGTMLKLSAALFIFGVACAAIGAGVMMIGLGISALAVALSAGGSAIVAFVASLVNMIPYVIEQIGVGIIKLCEVIAGGAEAICKAVTVIIIAVVDALVASIPHLVDGLLVLISELLLSLVEYTPTIVAAIFDFLIALIDGIAEKLPDLIQAGVNLLMSFFAGVVDALKSVDPTVLVNGLLAVGVLSAIVGAMAVVSLLVPAAMVGVLGMGAVITELAFVLAAIGALAQIPGLDWLVSEGGQFMQTVGTAIGKFIGGLTGGFAETLSSSLPQIGTDLSAFISNAKGFIDGARSIDPGSMEGVKSLVGIIAALTAVDILDGLTSWFTGGSSLVSFGEELAAFGPSMKAYADSVAGIDAGAVTASATAAKALTEMTSNIPNEGGVAAWFAGENSIAKFGSELVTLGEGLTAYSSAITGFDAAAVTSSASAATALAEMTSTIPNEGGVAAWFAGENSISKFGSDLVQLGAGLAAYSTAITGFDAAAVISSASAAQAIVDMTSTIPNEGGMVAWFTGENSVSKFSSDLVRLGAGLSAYSTSIAGFDAAAVTASASAASALVDMTSNIPNEGGMVAWFTGENSISKFSGELVQLGAGLSAYSTAITGFDAAAVTASVGAAQAIVNMTSTIPNEGGMVAWFTGENSISKFGSDLVRLGAGLSAYSTSITGFDAAAVTASTAAATALAQMTSTIPNEGGMVAWFTGENSISKFGSDLVQLGAGLSAYSTAIIGFDAAAVTASASAATALAAMTSTIPNEGGMIAWFTGENSISKFGSELVMLGIGLAAYSLAITGFDAAAVTASASAASALAAMTSTIPNEGGMVAWFAGENSISKFSSELVRLGAGLSAFSVAIVDVQPENIVSAANAAKSLAEMASYIPNEGGLKAWFCGDNSVASFAGQLEPLGTGLAKFSTAVADVIPENITAAANAAKSLAEMANSAPADTTVLSTFGSNLGAFGENLASYFTKVSGISLESISVSTAALRSIKDSVANLSADSLTSAANGIKSLGKSLGDLSKINAGSVSGFVAAINKVAEADVQAMVSTFSKAGPQMSTAGSDLIAKFVEGVNGQIEVVSSAGKNSVNSFISAITTNTNTAKTGCTKFASDCATAISSQSSSFKSAGKDFANGLIIGMNLKYWEVYRAGYDLGRAAVLGEKAGQDSNSPSKETIKAGKWLGEGLVIGMDKMSAKVYNAGYSLGEDATKSVSSTISRVADAISTDIDSQPTIRPVLDLSDVRSGASAISGMFNKSAAIGVHANVGEISSMMNERRQNGANDDVVSAINKLNQKMDGMGNTSYTINGVTYDDGSNVSSAIQSLVRYAKIERRV